MFKRNGIVVQPNLWNGNHYADWLSNFGIVKRFDTKFCSQLPKELLHVLLGDRTGIVDSRP